MTPALVTYYFPERTRLIEAATLPVVQGLVDRVRACTEHDGPARQRVFRAIEILLEFYARDAAVIALFDQHRASTPDAALPDLSKDLDGVVESVFEAWLIDHPDSLYDATFLRKAMIGACKTLARQRTEASPRDALDDQDRRRFAEMMCSLLMGTSSAGAPPDAPTSVDSENRGL